MLTQLYALFARATDMPVLPGEEPDLTERKRTLGSILLFGSTALLSVGVLFAVATRLVPAGICIAYLLHVFACFLVLRVTGRGFVYSIYVNCFLVQVVSLALAWVMGGFFSSGCVFIWAFTSPLTLGLLPRGNRSAAAFSLVVFLALLVFLVDLDPQNFTEAAAGDLLTRVMSMINLGIFFVLVMVSTTSLVRGLASTSADLQALNRTLDQRVQLRTVELVNANKELRIEMEERARAEQALVESESKLRHAQKMESIGRLAGGIAHDFNNLLTVMLSYCELVLSTPEMDEDTAEDVGEIKAAAERASKLTRQLLAFGRQQIFEVKVLDLNDLIEEMIPMLERLIGEDIVLDVTMSPEAGKVLADRGQLEQVLMNLVVNARDAMPSGGTLGIQTGGHTIETTGGDPDFSELTRGRYARLSVSDTGHGMDAQTRSRIFDPFFTTKPTGKGTGLGLSTAYGIIKQSEGMIAVSSELGEGSVFDVLLPETDKVADTAVITPRKPAHRAGNETILLVEDEDQVRDVIGSILTRNGYHVLDANGATQAFELCDAHQGEIDLLLTDLVMPQMNGRQLADEMGTRRPGIRVLYMSGYAGEVAMRMGIETEDIDFMQKPILPGALVARVREVLSTTPSHSQNPSGLLELDAREDPAERSQSRAVAG